MFEFVSSQLSELYVNLDYTVWRDLNHSERLFVLVQVIDSLASQVMPITDHLNCNWSKMESVYHQIWGTKYRKWYKRKIRISSFIHADVRSRKPGLQFLSVYTSISR